MTKGAFKTKPLKQDVLILITLKSVSEKEQSKINRNKAREQKILFPKILDPIIHA